MYMTMGIASDLRQTTTIRQSQPCFAKPEWRFQVPVVIAYGILAALRIEFSTEGAVHPLALLGRLKEIPADDLYLNMMLTPMIQYDITTEHAQHYHSTLKYMCMKSENCDEMIRLYYQYEPSEFK